MRTRVGITDDHTLVTAGIKEVLKHYGELEIIWTAANASQAVAACKSKVPDVLLLDINLPDKNGIKLCEELLNIYPQLKIIGLSSYDKATFVKQLAGKGASGYLLKNANSGELYEAIKTVATGGTYYQPVIKELLVGHALGKQRSDAFQPALTRREKQVLALIAAQLTTREIASELYLSIKTVESHRHNLMQKLGARNSIGIVQSAMEKGLL